MATPESKVKAKVSALLKKYDVYYEMPVPTGFGKSGLDYTGCNHGKFFAVETKAGNKLPTPRQLTTVKRMQQSGGSVFVVNEVTGLHELEQWLEETRR